MNPSECSTSDHRVVGDGASQPSGKTLKRVAALLSLAMAALLSLAIAGGEQNTTGTTPSVELFLTGNTSMVFLENNGVEIVRVSPDGTVKLRDGITAEQAIVKMVRILQRDLPAQSRAISDMHAADMKACMDGWKHTLDVLAPPKEKVWR